MLGILFHVFLQYQLLRMHSSYYSYSSYPTAVLVQYNNVIQWNVSEVVTLCKAAISLYYV